VGDSGRNPLKDQATEALAAKLLSGREWELARRSSAGPPTVI
jgi:hypothetical protein